MKRKQLIKHLTGNGAVFLREGRKHSIYKRGPFRTMVPRHMEIVDELARKIVKTWIYHGWVSNEIQGHDKKKR